MTSGPHGCSAPSCGQGAVSQWQRYGTLAEYRQIMTGQLAPRDGILKISVFGCAAHAPAETPLTITHRHNCTWPATCLCQGADAAPDYAKGEG